MKKLLLLFVFLLAACGAPDEPAEVEPIVEKVVTVIVEVEKIVEVAAVPTEVPESACPDGWPQEWTDLGEQCPEVWDVWYFKTTQQTALWYDTGLQNDAGYPIYQIVSPAIAKSEGTVLVAYNGNQVTEYYRNLDGSIAIAGPSFANAQDFRCVEPEDLVFYAPDPTGICGDGLVRTVLFPGLYRGDGGMHFYKVLSGNDAGYFVRADHVFLPFCEDLTLDIPESCTQ